MVYHSTAARYPFRKPEFHYISPHKTWGFKIKSSSIISLTYFVAKAIECFQGHLLLYLACIMGDTKPQDDRKKSMPHVSRNDKTVVLLKLRHSIESFRWINIR